MKTISFLSALALTTAFFTSCNKTQYNVTPETKSASSILAAEDSKGTTPMQSLLVVSSGYANAANFSLYGNQQLVYSADQLTHVDLFKPLADAGIHVMPGYYSNLELRMKTAASNGMAGLYLKGVVRIDDDIFVPVEIIVDGVADIRAFPKIDYVQQGTTMFGLMNLTANRIGMGITQQMWEAARSSANPVITISARQNPDLYRIVLTNLGTMMHIGITGTQVTTTTDSEVMQ